PGFVFMAALFCVVPARRGVWFRGRPRGRFRSRRWTRGRGPTPAVYLEGGMYLGGARGSSPGQAVAERSFLMSSRAPSTRLLALSSPLKSPASSPFLSITYVLRLVLPRMSRKKLVASYLRASSLSPSDTRSNFSPNFSENLRCDSSESTETPM